MLDDYYMFRRYDIRWTRNGFWELFFFGARFVRNTQFCSLYRVCCAAIFSDVSCHSSFVCSMCAVFLLHLISVSGAFADTINETTKNEMLDTKTIMAAKLPRQICSKSPNSLVYFIRFGYLMLASFYIAFSGVSVLSSLFWICLHHHDGGACLLL